MPRIGGSGLRIRRGSALVHLRDFKLLDFELRAFSGAAYTSPKRSRPESARLLPTNVRTPDHASRNGKP